MQIFQLLETYITTSFLYEIMQIFIYVILLDYNCEVVHLPVNNHGYLDKERSDAAELTVSYDSFYGRPIIPLLHFVSYQATTLVFGQSLP